MSNSLSVLNGKVSAGDVTVSDLGLRGMITVRGDLGSKALVAACTNLTGAAMPAVGKISTDDDSAICWMSPDELLLLVPYESVPDAMEHLASALKGTHHLAVNVSDARALICVSGSYARGVIAKLAPVDLHPDSFRPGDLRRSRLGQIAAAFWMTDEETINVICFRSVADYAFGLLAASAQAGPVDYLSKA